MQAGVGLAGAVQLSKSGLVWAADPDGGIAVDHHVPALKNLDPGWLRELYARGTRTAFSGTALDTLGMPCGGICSGQVYVRGDGTLAHWWIANDAYDTGPGLMQQIATVQGTYEQGYHTFRPFSPLQQGFAIETRNADGAVQLRRLDREGFDDIEFFGEYPVATIEYDSRETGDFPVGVRAEVFSPFIPLNSRDSSIPVTILRFSVSNRSDQPVDVTLTGWLQNGVFLGKRGRLQAATRNRVRKSPGMTTILMDSVPLPDSPLADRQTRVFEDFESGDYSNWQVEGKAFGTVPATGGLPGQQLPPLPIEIDWDTSIGDWQGDYFANSFHGGYQAEGTLTSRPFVVENRYIVFQLSGGFDFRKTSINLYVGGKLVRSAGGAFLDLKLRERYWDVDEFAGKEARLVIVDAGDTPLDFINVDNIYFSDVPPLEDEIWSEQHPQHGNMALTALDDDARAWTDCGSVDDFLRKLAEGEKPVCGEETIRDLGDDHIAGLESSFSLLPGESKTRTFLVTWFFPNRPLSNTRTGFSTQVPVGERVGNRYEIWYEDSADVATYVARNFGRLTRDTMLFRDTYFDSTLPYWFLQRVAMPLSALATQTCQWWSNGRFWAFEGVGCCVGTCTHVWNYAHGLARLFPDLERSVREFQDLDEGMDPDTGAIVARGRTVGSILDGQAGAVLKAYREHLISEDGAFLERNWPRIKLAMDWLIAQDDDGDGLIEGKQHNTYDVDFYGANTMVGSLYLAALRAGEEMALIRSERDYAERLRTIFERGGRESIRRLWNGSYFEQDVDLEQHPVSQYAAGCLSDQMFGQGWAHQLGIGYIYPPEYVRRALRSVWKNNWAPDVITQNAVHNPLRTYADPGESGLFVCTWPRSRHPGEAAVRYKNEVWTGIEYQVAGHMLYEDMIDEGLAMIRAIHERYDGTRHNPWNEIECGDHYARALASWGCLLAVSGFAYDGPAGIIEFAPKLSPGDFRAFFSAAAGWGHLVQRRSDNEQRSRIELRWGRLEISTVRVYTGGSSTGRSVSVSKEDNALEAVVTSVKDRVEIRLVEPVELEAGQELEVRIV
jgi:uncharacterized protein (DUF608 family)